MTKLHEMLNIGFRTDKKSDGLNSELMRDLAFRVRYGPARLAIALSLSNKKRVDTDHLHNEERGKEIRGTQMLGQECPAALVSLITQHAGRALSTREIQAAISAHWARGIKMLRADWETSGKDYDKFLANLIDRIGGSRKNLSTSRSLAVSNGAKTSLPSPDAIDLPIGTFASGAKRGQPAQWRINGPGYPPHIAVMGAPGGGKTRLALDLVKAIKEKSGCSTFLFDMKGDIATDDELRRKMDAQVISSETSVPLDILHVAKKDNVPIQNAAARLCDSVDFASGSALGPMQKTTLRQTAARLIEERDRVSLDQLCDAYQEEIDRGDSVSATLTRMRDLKLFKPEFQPANFFSRNWIFDLHNAAQDTQRFSSLMILDALNRHFMALPDAPVDAEGNRQIQTLLVIDEAHRILGHKLPALSDIVRMSRSKGGAVILISQSPNDYFKEEASLLENIGLIVSYRTNATPASVRKVFSENFAVTDLKTGVCAVRFPGESTQKVKVWG